MALNPEQRRQNRADRTMELFVRKGKTSAIEICAKTLQELRRLEEADDEGYCTCVTCGKVRKWNRAMEGGHYIPRTSLATKLLKENVWPQCTSCNHYGNGELGKFAEHLDALGPGLRLHLEAMKGTRQYTYAELVEMRLRWQDEIKEHKRRING